jgi:hypothetical protein
VTTRERDEAHHQLAQSQYSLWSFVRRWMRRALLIDMNFGYLLLDLRLVATVYFRGVAVKNGRSWTRCHWHSNKPDQE